MDPSRPTAALWTLELLLKLLLLLLLTLRDAGAAGKTPHPAP